MSGNLVEGVEEEVSDALPQGGRLDDAGRLDALGGASGVEASHLLVSETPQMLPYCCGVVEGIGFGRCGGWWRGVWRWGWCWRGGGSSMLRAGFGHGVSIGGRGRGGSRSCASVGGAGCGARWGSLCGVSVFKFRGGRSVGDALLGPGGAEVGVVLDGHLGIPPGLLGGVCVCLVRV